MKLKEIRRTSTFAWSPTEPLPLLATGTVAGALDESFSNESQLELWSPNFFDKTEYELGGIGQNGPAGFVTDTARFNRLAWGAGEGGRSRGVIAAGMENGELVLWDPSKILSGAGNADSLILRNTTHTGPVRGLDFNPIQTNLLASGGVSGEVYIWDLKDPSKPYTPTPGTRSTKLDEITSIAWNQQVQYVLAGASSTGYTVVWDLRGKREVVALAYGGGAGTLAGQVSSGAGLAVGGRRGMSDIAWHPENATRLVTASEDDSSPVIMVWDLRNARAPEKILTGHEKGVLSLSWCTKDADLLLSCGKDNRALCWNPQTSEIIGELPSADNWAFQVDWCPRNPDLLATAFFDGTIGLHSIQSTNEAASAAAPVDQSNGADIFDAPGFSRAQSGTLSLKQPPKWLRCPNTVSFGFGGQLVTVSNLPSAQGKNQSSAVHIRKVVTEDDLVERAAQLQGAIDDESLEAFAEGKSATVEIAEHEEGWKALLSLFKANSRDELVTLLGFSKEDVSARVAEAVEALKISGGVATVKTTLGDDVVGGRVVSFAEPERDEEDAALGSGSGLEKTPSELSASVVSDATSALPTADGESTTTVPSLFGDDVPGTPQDGGDFFSTLGTQNDNEVHVPHTNYGLDSSVAATIGSRPSSVASELRGNSFRIYPSDESDTDRLVTKALVLGDFESAVSLCLSSDRFADAILLAVRGGPELLQKTQKAYFERRTQQLPYLRLFQSVVTNDLADIVQNADLQEWQEIFVVLCTFANQEEFPALAEQLGRRLEFQFTIALESEDPEVSDQANEFRKNATLTYLAAARLERLVGIWSDELVEEEEAYVDDEKNEQGTYYTAHAHALQTFVEKVTVFRSATKYDDVDLGKTGDIDASAFKLSGLYDRYLEYAELLASQGLRKEAAVFLRLIPTGYKAVDLAAARDRVLGTKSAAPSAPKTQAVAAPSVPAKAPSAYPGYTSYGPQSTTYPPAAPAHTTPYNTYQPTQTAAPQTNPYAQVQPAPQPNPYAHTQHASQPTGPYAPQQQATQPTGPYAPTNTFTTPTSYAPVNLSQPPHLRQQVPPPSSGPLVPPPPRAANGGHPPPKRQDVPGWNDAPAIPTSRSPSTLNSGKPSAITSPFPNAAPSPAFAPPGSPFQATGSIPPPPRPGSVNRGIAPPPPPPQRGGPPQPGSAFPPHMRPPSSAAGGPPHPGMASQPPPRLPTPSQYAPPPPRGPVSGQTPSPGPYGPPSHGHGQPPPPSGHYGPGPGQPGQQGYPPPGGQPGYAPQQHQPGPGGPVPPHHSDPYAPPPGQQRSGPPGPHQGGPGPMGGPPPPGGPGGQPRPTSNAPPARAGPPPPKYPPGDRSHIPDNLRPAFNVISERLDHLRQSIPPHQKRLVDDLERRINPLFDALNCETLSPPVADQLLVLTRAMEAHDRQAALAIHIDLLTRGSQTDDIAMWMSGLKQLIQQT
ncbi:hypothetical protein BDN72DRAFT_794932 [Pluteus cervinus]|uniref:Uncharacterized protein n=1 Tax=Pluteus cervinus TaxID=181527 RepID=A0ACD3AZH4_9AGAR|nr:hypothetical protein BDN72DRAFT_794932 [Pluteus cervinus]